MAGRILYRGPWYVPYKAVEVLCSDGKRRTCTTAIEADSFFTLPARCKVKGKTVSGFLYHSDTEGELIFCHYEHRKNGKVLPPWNTK